MLYSIFPCRKLRFESSIMICTTANGIWKHDEVMLLAPKWLRFWFVFVRQGVGISSKHGRIRRGHEFCVFPSRKPWNTIYSNLGKVTTSLAARRMTWIHQDSMIIDGNWKIVIKVLPQRWKLFQDKLSSKVLRNLTEHTSQNISTYL